MLSIIASTLELAEDSCNSFFATLGMLSIMEAPSSTHSKKLTMNGLTGVISLRQSRRFTNSG